MTVALKKQLDESLRDALLALYLNTVAPHDETTKTLGLKTAQHLYEYWLLDVLVSQDVPTTPVACAIASLQQYINRILMNMEPGYDATTLTPERMQTWRNEMHQYPIWAAHQQLLYFPSIYLDPSLRNNKSDNFRQLENDLSQNRTQPDAVQSAVLAYLTRFEEVANLQILNGYIDGEDFANSTYYFIAKSRSENTYFWRSLNMAQRPLDGAAAPLPASAHKLDQPDPYAWSDWEKADVPIADQAIEHTIRPVWFNNRLFVIWAECIHQNPASLRTTSPGSGNVQPTKGRPLLRLNLCYKKQDGSWSTPRVCLQGYSEDETLLGKDVEAIKPLVGTAAVQHRKKSRDLLFLTLCVHESKTESTVAAVNRCVYLNTAYIDKNLTQESGVSASTKQAVTKINDHHRSALSTLKDSKSGRVQAKDQFKEKTSTTIEHTDFELPSGTDAAISNFNGYQSRINATRRPDPSSSTLTLSLTTSNNFTQGISLPRRTNAVSFFFSTRPDRTPQLDLRLKLSPRSLPNTTHVKLDDGSHFEAPNNLLERPDRTYSLSFDNLTNILINNENSLGFTLNNGTDLSGKLISTAAAKHLIQIHTNRSNSTDAGEVKNVRVQEAGGSPLLEFNTATFQYYEPLRIQYVIFRQAETSRGHPLDHNHLEVVAKSNPVEELTEDFSHTWTREDIDGAGETFFYGIALTRPDEPGKPIYSALKAINLDVVGSPTSRRLPDIAYGALPRLRATQFLDFSGSEIANTDAGTLPRETIRLNTTLAPELIRRTVNSFDELFSRETQHLPEPHIESDTKSRMDFHGPYGRYFTELFLYLPWLVAHRLNTEHQYDEAERWIRYAFDPGRKRSNCWGSVPLTADTSAAYADQAPHDPHQIALSHPVHFRKALYFLYLDILINRGDSAYRTLTPDSLAEAKLWYVRTQDLLGPRPIVQQVDQWPVVDLQTLSETSSKNLRTFERSQTGPTANRPLLIHGSNPQTSLPAIDTPHLRLPFIPLLLKRWDIVESRLYNLRHNLDITGKPLHLPLFAAPADPRATLGTKNALSGSSNTASGLPDVQIPHYRFSAMYSQALNAVESVCQFGATLLSLIERKEQTQLQDMQQQQVWDLAKLAVDLQTQALQIDRKNKEALLASKAIIQGRLNHYQQLLEKDVTQEESAAGSLYLSSGAFEATASASQVAAGGMMMVPNIFGFSNGGSRWEGAMHAATALAQGSALAARTAASHLDRTAQFRRRREEWTLTRDQAGLELKQIAKQLEHFTELETATGLQLRQAKTAVIQAKASYDFLSKRFTDTQLYQWLNSQFAALYYQAYDATLALCRATEACWQYEIADFGTHFVQPGTWNTTYRGFGAGEQLKLSLLKMQSEYWQRHQRELEIRKTVSLRLLKKKDSTSSINKEWEDIQTSLKSGVCDFELTNAMFEDDYKGQNHYLRRIKTVSVSLPAVLGPYENVRATLTQTASKVFMSAGDKGQLMESRRASQQIALSTGIDDNGLFTLNFNDERYLPFEYTGAISTWRLTFPNPEAQKALLESLTDILVHVSYTARAGGGAQ